MSKRARSSATDHKALKRRLAETFDEAGAAGGDGGDAARGSDGGGEAADAADNATLPDNVPTIIRMLTKETAQAVASPSLERSHLRKLTHQLVDLCKHEDLVDAVVSEGAIEAVVPLLDLKPDGDSAAARSCIRDVQRQSCFILGLLAVKPEYQARISRAGALAGLVRLLREATERLASGLGRGSPGSGSGGGGGAARRAADAITNLAHENSEIKNTVREEGGVPPLVSLLSSFDVKVQRASAGALRTLAFKNEDNKNQIVECGALPVLIRMLRSADTRLHYEAVGVVGNLVHSSTNIKRQVLEDGALQPVINLLSSPCADSQREAALLLGQFATADADTKARIAQRGAVPPLVRMLAHADNTLREMAAFALGRLAQNADNQAGIVQCGGLVPLLTLLESKHYNLQHNAAFALYGLADNDDNIPDIVREGVLQRLLDCVERLQVMASKDCVQKTIARMDSKFNGRVLAHVVFMLRSADRAVRQHAAIALARMAPEADIKSIFLEQRGLDILLDALVEDLPPLSARAASAASGGGGGGGGGGSSDRDAHRECGTLAGGDDDNGDGSELSGRRAAAAATLLLVRKISALSGDDECMPAQPPKTVYLGSQYVNNATLADITFVVEGRTFHAHRIALLASSDAFRAMFSGGYREKEAASIEIPNIPWDVFESMMHYIYTGNTEVKPASAAELLRASDQYLLEGLKRLCESCIAQDLTLESLVPTFELSENFSAPQLAKRCVLFVLEHFEMFVAAHGADTTHALMRRMVPELRRSVLEDAARLAPPLVVVPAPAPPPAPVVAPAPAPEAPIA